MLKKNIIIIVSILVISSFLYVIFTNKKDEVKIDNNINNSVNNNVNNKNEYIYQENLLDLNYTIDEIKLIESKIKDEDVRTKLLEKKYDNLSKFLSSPYFNLNNIERYESYYQKNQNYTSDEVVMNVEIGLDKDFYTDINEITDYKDVTTLVNKYNKLPDDVNFDDLVTIDKSYSNGDNKQLRKVAYDALVQMINAAKNDNIKLFVVSAYRTKQTQESLFNNSVKKNGVNHALLYSAKSGHSEHQLGLAVDLNSVSDSFENTKEAKWLKDNAYKYGFILRYPKNKEYITGYGYEPWHYRYLGIDISTKIYQENITYEEYVVKYKK